MDEEEENIIQSINNGGSGSSLSPLTEASLADYIQKKNKLKSLKEKQRKKSFYLSTWIFLKMISIITFIALFSAFIQIRGLVGDDGILPVSKVLETKIASNEINTIWLYFTHPTKGLGISVNNTLHMLCFIGLTFSALSIFTTTIAMYVGIMWFCYYCIVDVGQLFFSYQWDQLLLEALFLTIFLSPFNPKYEEKPSTPIRYLLKWLLFRLMFGSGLVKLTPIWAGLQAMNYHYETQCIPNVFSWYLNQLPPVIHQFETMMVLAIEILLPALYFAPRTFRLFASFTTVLFQMLIFLTGNYNFFNYLTIGLCALLQDDAFLLKLPMPEKIRIKLLEIESRRFKDIQLNRQNSRANGSNSESGLSSLDPKNLLVPFMFILLGTSSLMNVSQYFQKNTVPLLIQRIHSSISLYHLTGTYGLFSHVTTERYEIIIEGSYDQLNWMPYEFYYKPGNLSRHPPFVFPGHQPRLDWQMWFAALSKDSNSQPWLIHFMAKLLEGSPEVLSLIEYSPFPIDQPPSYIRAQKYKYHFTTFYQNTNINNNNNNINNNNNVDNKQSQQSTSSTKSQKNKDNKESSSTSSPSSPDINNNNNNNNNDENNKINQNNHHDSNNQDNVKKETITDNSNQIIKNENDWWTREFTGPFVKPFSLKSQFYLNFLSNENNKRKL